MTREIAVEISCGSGADLSRAEQLQSQSLLSPAQLMPAAKQRGGAAPYLDNPINNKATEGKARKSEALSSTGLSGYLTLFASLVF